MIDIPKLELDIINEKLPKGFDWTDVSYLKLGNVKQLVYDKKLIGYINIEDESEPYFMGSQKAK